MLISELAEKTGLSRHTIRFYEKAGLLDERRYIRRGANNYRDYAEAAVDRIKVIKDIQAAGFTLSEIKTLLNNWDEGSLTFHDGLGYLQQKLTEIEKKIAALEQIKATLTMVLDRAASSSDTAELPSHAAGKVN